MEPAGADSGNPRYHAQIFWSSIRPRAAGTTEMQSAVLITLTGSTEQRPKAKLPAVHSWLYLQPQDDLGRVTSPLSAPFAFMQYENSKKYPPFTVVIRRKADYILNVQKSCFEVCAVIIITKIT